MKLSVPCALLAAILVAAPRPASPQEAPVAFVGARLVPIEGPEIPNGVLVVHRGRIVAVGDAATTRVPAGAARRDVAGKVILPGLVDTHSHIGSVEGADASAPLQPDVRVLDSIDVRSPQIQKAQAGGITTVNVMPGSGHLLSGQTLYLKLRDGGTIDDLTHARRRRAPARRHQDGQRHQPAARRRRSRGRGPSPPRWCASSS